MFLKMVRIGPINRKVNNRARAGKNCRSDCIQSTEAAAAHLQPATPTIVEPPIVMVHHQRQIALRTKSRQFPDEQQVAPDGRIVRPNQRVIWYGAVKKLLQRGVDLFSNAARRAVLFGEIVEGGLNEEFDRY